MQNQEKPPYIPITNLFSVVDCKQSFSQLSLKEKLYAYYFTRASWQGSKICYFQRSYESPALFYILIKIFLAEPIAILSYKLKILQFTDVEIQQLFSYCAAFFQNCGNYKSFGDTKFIPEISKDKFYQFIKTSRAYTDNVEKFELIWQSINLEIYEYKNPYFQIETIDKNGLTGYYSANLTKAEVEVINKYLESINISPLNTRVIKYQENQVQIYNVLIASASVPKQPQTAQYEGLNIRLTYGDFYPFLRDLNFNLAQCLPYCSNENQTQMIIAYLKHFNNGDMELHKDSQRHWIKDKGPVIETNIGFIESYLDPLKVRAEFEGFVSVQNKDESLKLNKLVQNAEEIIKNLTWPKEFEIEKFTKPDFTSLDILGFACSGTPVGINIPNYDEIRQNEGFKNVNLGNVYGTPNKENVQYTEPDVIELFVKYYKPSLFVLVALHELLGHGTGKLFSIDKDGKLNFDQNNVLNPITNEKITTFYNVNETYHGKFGQVSSGYEECRADGVGLYLSTFQDVLNILIPEFNVEQQKDIVYMVWYDIVYGAIRGLEYYIPDNKKWGQAHIQASWVLFKIMREADPNFVKINKIQKPDGQPSFILHLERDLIWTVGKKAVGEFLRSIADVQGGTQFFEGYSRVDDDMLELRQIVINNKLPRKLEIQGDVQLIGKDEDVTYVGFPESFEGLIQSQVYHHNGNVESVFDQWLLHKQHFRFQQKF